MRCSLRVGFFFILPFASEVSAQTSDPYEHPEGEYHELLPQFTYSLFGSLQQIYGYKNLKIKLYYAAGSLVTYLDVSYDEKISDHSPGAKPTDVIGIIREYIPEGKRLE